MFTSMAADRDKPNMNKPFSLSLTSTCISLFQAVLPDLNGPREGRAGDSVAPSHPILDRSEEAGMRCNLCDDKNSSSPCQNRKNNFHIILCARALKFPPQILSEIPYSHFDGAVKYYFVSVCDVSSNAINKCRYIKSAAASSTMQERAWRQKQDFFGCCPFCIQCYCYFTGFLVGWCVGQLWIAPNVVSLTWGRSWRR